MSHTFILPPLQSHLPANLRHCRIQTNSGPVKETGLGAPAGLSQLSHSGCCSLYQWQTLAQGVNSLNPPLCCTVGRACSSTQRLFQHCTADTLLLLLMQSVETQPGPVLLAAQRRP